MIDDKKDKKFLFQISGALIIVLFPYIIFARMVIGGLNFEIYDAFLYAGFICIAPILAIGFPVKYQIKYMKVSNELDCLDSFVSRPKQSPDEFYFPVESVYEIEIDFGDDSSLTKKINSDNYRKFYTTYLKHKINEQVKKGKLDRTKATSFLNTIEKEIEDQLQGNKQPDLKLRDKILKEAKSKGIETKGLLPEKDIDLRKFKENLSEEDKEFLKKLKLYHVILKYEQKWKDEKDTFKSFFLLTPGSYTDNIKLRPGEGNIDGWWVGTKECFCYFIFYTQLSKDEPLLFLRFTEHMGDKVADHIRKMEGEIYAYIELKVMEVWIAHLDIAPQKLKKENVHLKQEVMEFKEAYSDMIQSKAKQDKQFGYFFESQKIREARQLSEKYKRNSYIYITAMFFLFIIFLIILTISFTK